jgi:predicted NUDIX family NTP pyrophosphohydrolase
VSNRVAKRSAGILLYRSQDRGLQVLLVHPGGPFWARRERGVWSVPKGEYEPDEDALAAARREFEEEIGQPAPDAEPIDLGEVVQKNGKLVRAYALPGDLDASAIVSNTFALEWPPRSGTIRQFPEVDRAQWFTLDEAREKLVPAQIELVERLQALLVSETGSDSSP